MKMNERNPIEDILSLAELATNTQCLELQRELVRTIQMINSQAFIVNPADIPLHNLKPGEFLDTTFPYRG